MATIVPSSRVDAIQPRELVKARLMLYEFLGSDGGPRARLRCHGRRPRAVGTNCVRISGPCGHACLRRGCNPRPIRQLDNHRTSWVSKAGRNSESFPRPSRRLTIGNHSTGIGNFRQESQFAGPASMSHDSNFCPDFHRAVELIGRRWSGAIVREMLAGTSRFTDLHDAIPDISDRMLCTRLRELEAEGGRGPAGLATEHAQPGRVPSHRQGQAAAAASSRRSATGRTGGRVPSASRAATA